MADLLLDTAYFPGVDQAFDAAASVGAKGWFAYIFDPYLPNGNGGWTPANVAALMDRGMGIIPIYVPGGSPIGTNALIAILHGYGFYDGAIVIDIEGGSDPGQHYVDVWCHEMAALGYFPIVYGLPSTVAAYSNEAFGIWIAKYPPWTSISGRICQGSAIMPGLEPTDLPDFNTTWHADARAWQYANSFNVNGVDVDANASTLPVHYKQEPAPVIHPPVHAPDFFVTVKDGAHWFDQPDHDTGQVAQFTPGTVLHIVEVKNDGATDWYRPDIGTWWLNNLDTVEVPAPAKPVRPPEPPVVEPPITTTATLDTLDRKLDAVIAALDVLLRNNTHGPLP